MKQVRLDGLSSVRIVDAPAPSPGPGQVVIETAASALCGSELGAYRGDGMPAGNSGHEAAGVVAEVGPDVETLRPGQRVGVSAIAGCGTCAFCELGQYTWCNAFKFYGSMHSERFLAAANACHALPADVPWDVGVLISGDGLGVPYHTSRKIAADTVRTIAVFGLGPIGLGNVLIQSHLGRRVIGLDMVTYRLERARQLGASDTIDVSAGDANAAVRELTNGQGVDVAIEATGKPEAVRACFAAVRKGGTVVFNGEQGQLPLSPSDDFIRRDISAVGSWFYHFSEFADMLALYRSGLPVAELVSHRIPLSDAEEAFTTFAQGQSGKVLLTY